MNLVILGLIPQQCRGDTTKAQRCEFHRFAGWVDITQFAFGDVVFGTHLGQLPTCVTGAATGRLAQQVQRNQHGDQDRQINQFIAKTARASHAAISRVLRKK